MALPTWRYARVGLQLTLALMVTACEQSSQAQATQFQVTQSQVTQSQVTQSQAMKNNKIELQFGNGTPQHAIIWLHGLGATADDFPPIVPELGLDQNRPISFVFPQAPNRPITINNGMRMPGWYDIKGTDISDKQDAQGMAESQATLEALISDQLEAGIPSQNIIIAGFSQGGAVTYHTGLRSQHELAGMLTLSTYLPFADDVSKEQSQANLNTPIFASHGTLDQMVPIQLGQASVEGLKALGYKVDWKTYPMEHQVSMEQIKDVGAWINSVFTAAK